MKLRVLLVEDEAINILLLKFCLESFGCEVIGIASTGELAVKMAETEKPDVIFMDILLGGKMDGIEAANIIKANAPFVNIVYASAFSDPETIERACLVGCEAYIEKPFEPEMIKITLEKIRKKYIHKDETIFDLERTTKFIGGIL